ncbi:MAG: PIG-L family deacetylase [Anaerolineales bacterium]|nr:PIG-L family deacetylase [Anaerolineales bacterium]
MTKTSPPNRPLRLLAVFAHPDDESFGPGGTLALYAQRGVEVHLICATRGEVGAAPAELLAPHADIASLRESELRCAAGHLGLAGVHFLGYRDSGMPGSADNRHPQALAAAPLEEVAHRLVWWFRRLRPQVVITFDPIGGYRHPDHIAIHRATIQAFDQAGDADFMPEAGPAHQADKLYYASLPRRALRLIVRLMPLVRRDPRHFGQNGDIDLVDIAAQDFPIHTRINIRPVARLKAQASACHASQGGMPRSGIMGWLLRLAGGSETFTRAVPPADPGLREDDLFTDISPNIP